MEKYDFLVVGQGLAGTIIAYLLIQENKKVLVIDDNSFSSSKVAAGMFNIIGGKRMIKTWMAEELLQSANLIYPEFEKFLNTKFYHPTNIVHAFQSEKEIIQTENRLKESEYTDYFEYSPEINFNQLNLTLEYINIKGGGWLDIKTMIKSFRDYLISEKIILTEQLNYQDLIYQNKQYIYKDFVSDNIVFCEGYKSKDNPFFTIPFQFSKGEVVVIKTNEKLPDNIFKKGIYLVHLTDNLYKVGATYEWQDLELKTTEKALSFFKSKLDQLLNIEYEIIDQYTGIRPTILDKKPVIGEHQDYKNMYIFNGLGTKGTILAPYFANKAIDFIINKTELTDDIDIKRFEKLNP